ncbi:MAG: protein translocase subunit yidC [Candidatus Solibacter sp.]|nr:protein translocase subunit yidC [Candidatus Solibacter sp.]
MSDPVNGGNNLAQPPKKEMSMEVRLLLAFVLMGVVMFVTQYIMPAPPAKPPAKKDATAQTTPPPGAKDADATSTAPASAVATVQAASLPANATPQKPEPNFIIDTDLYRISISNQGATVRSWQFKKYKGNDEKPLDVVNSAGGLDFPFALYFPAQKPASNVNWTWYKQTGDPDGLGVTYEFSDGHVTVRKVFRFQKNSYLSRVSTEVTLDGQSLPHLIEWRGGFGDLTVSTAPGAQRTLYYDVTQNKLVEQTPKAASKGPVTASGNFSFAGIADNYFAAVFLPVGATTTTLVTFEDTVRTPITKPDEKPVPLSGMAVGAIPANRFELFVGPKDLDLLRRINPKLEQVVDFGWLAVLAKPLFLIVNYVNNTIVHNFGWAIVLVTVAINFILFPLKLSNMKSMRKMQALKPQVDAINAKYKNVGLRDPKAADKNQETMDLYKKHGVNPMGGCIPMLLQIPFFFAFYKVFTVSVEMRGAPWLWVADLSQPETIPIKILPLVMIASQFIMQRMTPQPAGDPAQQKMMMFMPLVFGFMFYNFPSGLVLYYLTSNLVSMGQQWFFNKTSMANLAAESIAPPRKNGRK